MTLAEFRGWLRGYAAAFVQPGKPTPQQWCRIMREAGFVRLARGSAIAVDFDGVGRPVIAVHAHHEVLE